MPKFGNGGGFECLASGHGTIATANGDDLGGLNHRTHVESLQLAVDCRHHLLRDGASSVPHVQLCAPRFCAACSLSMWLMLYGSLPAQARGRDAVVLPLGE